MLNYDEIGSPKNTSSTFGVRYTDKYRFIFRDDSGKKIAEFERYNLECCAVHGRFFVDCDKCQRVEVRKIMAKPVIEDIEKYLDSIYSTALYKTIKLGVRW